MECLGAVRRAEMQVLTANSVNDANDFSRQDAVSVRTVPVRARKKFVVTLPRQSVAVIALDLAR